MKKTIEVDTPSRLDQYLSNKTSYSRSQIVKLIKSSKIIVNNKIIDKPSFNVNDGDIIEVDFSITNVEKNIIPNDEIEINYLYRDKYLAVINKSRGIVVHPSSGHTSDTLVNYLLKQDDNYKYDYSDINYRPGIVHRIDKDTQGILIIAYSNDILNAIQKEIQCGNFHREYLALVKGKIKDQLFKIDAPLTKPNHTVRKAQVNTLKGKDAVTHFKLISTRNNVSLLKCTLETGRTHQIRAHLAYINHPIIGDNLYGGSNNLLNKGQCLTAYKIDFIHPVSSKRIICYAPLDDYFKNALRIFYK